jgi:hypothetical protein
MVAAAHKDMVAEVILADHGAEAAVVVLPVVVQMVMQMVIMAPVVAVMAFAILNTVWAVEEVAVQI